MILKKGYQFLFHQYKFFLNADLKERAHRRYQELIDAGENENATEVLKSISSRDKIDISRNQDPLIVAPGAKVIDSTNMSLSKVINFIIGEINNDQDKSLYINTKKNERRYHL